MEGNTILDSTEIRTNGGNEIKSILSPPHHGKAAKMISYEGEILDYVLYNKDLGNAVTSNDFIFKLWNMDETFW